MYNLLVTEIKEQSAVHELVYTSTNLKENSLKIQYKLCFNVLLQSLLKISYC